MRQATADDLEAVARRELESLLGGSFTKRIRRIGQSGWKDDAHIAGSYSYARPRQHGARQRLAVPLTERLAFAGEACSQSSFSTVHGAWESGIAAVGQILGEGDRGNQRWMPLRNRTVHRQA